MNATRLRIFAALNLAVLFRAEVELPWRAQLWLLPATAVGHLIGERFYARLLTMQTAVFYWVLGTALLMVSVIGRVKIWV